jgi:hypothetical protein
MRVNQNGMDRLKAVRNRDSRGLKNAFQQVDKAGPKFYNAL